MKKLQSSVIKAVLDFRVKIGLNASILLPFARLPVRV